MKRILPLLPLLLAACGGSASTRPVPRDTLRPVAPLPAAATDLSALPPSEVRASLGFGRVLPDAEVAELADRYGLRIYEVRLMLGEGPTLHDVPPGRTAAEALAEMRRVRADEARRWPCVLLARMGAMRETDRGVRPAPGDRDPGSRMLLSQVERARAAPERLLRGNPAVYGIKVIATAERLRAAAADPRVREVIAGMRDGPDGGWTVPGPQPPGEGRARPNPVHPSVDSLSSDEVRRRLDRFVAEGLPECRETLRNAEMSERTTRVEPEVVIGGVAFTVRTRVDSLREQGGIGPTRVAATITLENRTAQRVEVPVLGCTAGMRIYRDPMRAVPAGSAVGHGSRCMEEPYTVALAPGERREFDTGVEADRVLSDSVPPGRYFLSATFRLHDRTLELPAGSVHLRSGLESLRYAAGVQVRGGSLHARVTVTNAGTAPLALEYGGCALKLRAYRSAERSGPPAWRSEGRAPYDGDGFGYACADILYGATLAPRDSLRPFEMRVPLLEVLGDSLPDGRYFFTAVLALNFRDTPEIPAGDAVLSAQRRPLPAERRAGVMTFRARTAVSGGTVTATVTAVQSGAGGALVRFSEACPVVLHAYRSREARDAAPRSGPPAWVSRRDCPPGRVQHSLSRGEQRTFQVRASAREILGPGLPPGRYWFAVVVNHEAAPVFLAAGDAVLGP